MPKALFFNLPAYGHINPSLPLVAELVRRGHSVIYFASPKYRPVIEAAGATFEAYSAAIPDDFFESERLSGNVPQKVVYKLISTAQLVLPELLEKATSEKPDYVLYDGACPWGYMIAHILGVPAVVSLSLMAIGKPPPSAILNPDMLRMVISILARDFSKGVKANLISRELGKKYHIPPLGFTGVMNAPGDIAISYTSSYFQPYADTVPDTVHFVGRTIDETDETPSSEAFIFEQIRGRRLIYVSLGTINNDDLSFFKMCIEAFGGSDDFVVMTTGNAFSPDSFGRLPENISIRGWVPQLEVVRQADLFITHAGLGSVHDGLYYGVPLLLVPQTFEQTFIAQRVVELGAGLLLKKGQANAETIRANAERLLTETHFKDTARKIGDSFRAAGGAARGADEIEALLQKHATAG